MNFPAKTEYTDYYHNYIKLLPEGDPIALLEKAQDYTLAILENIPADLYDYQYAEGKWTIKELLLHLLDCEQILTYRALRFARHDFSSALPFNEDDYVALSDTASMDWDYIMTSTKMLRQYTIHFFKGIPEADFQLGGSDAFPCSIQATAAIIAAHQLHHIKVLQERYLKQPVKPFSI